MMRSIKSILSTDRERYKVPRKVQDVIPIRRIWLDGIFLVGNKFVKSWKFTDINYLVASREDKERMFLTYSELLNSLDSGATTKITVNNHHLKRSDFEDSILMPLKADGLDEYREEYNKMLLDKSAFGVGAVFSILLLRHRSRELKLQYILGQARGGILLWALVEHGLLSLLGAAIGAGGFCVAFRTAPAWGPVAVFWGMNLAGTALAYLLTMRRTFLETNLGRE